MNVSNRVSPVIQDIVERALEEIEASLDARVILAMDAGPRGAGAPSVDSPYQIRFVYVHRLDWYLGLTPGTDQIELPASDAFSLTGWDIRRLVRTIQESPLPETGWLTSASVYRADQDLLARLVGLQRRAWRPAEELVAQLTKAAKATGSWSFGDTLTTSEFLSALQPTLAARWIADGKGPLPYNIRELYADLDDDLKTEIDQMLEAKGKTPASAEVPPSSRSQIFMDTELPRLRALQIPASIPPAAEPFNRVVADTIRRFG
ncbi:DNA polymerase beta superfamily protein [Acetobacter conturbans]|uniref:Nucleotidyltransferase n=1 Tax=Acetobacter conturbans TaxID=1737472 RepID=A0ABX0JVE8_9PROT|nr:nucleotidyltransferase domain-containing protein [Acetobacter conturbans]NHN87473.1 hypothetical protein [Acetobacter conturbans]